MFQNGFALLKLSFSLAVVALPFGIVYCLLICLFPDAIEAFGAMRHYVSFSRWGGIENLFVLNSLLMGWVTIIVLERTVGSTGHILFAIALPCWVAAIGGGFASGAFFAERVPDTMWELLVYSLVSVVCAGALSIVWADMR